MAIYSGCTTPDEVSGLIGLIVGVCVVGRSLLWGGGREWLIVFLHQVDSWRLLCPLLFLGSHRLYVAAYHPFDELPHRHLVFAGVVIQCVEVSSIEADSQCLSVLVFAAHAAASTLALPLAGLLYSAINAACAFWRAASILSARAFAAAASCSRISRARVISTWRAVSATLRA